MTAPSTTPPSESALVVLIPEADDLLNAFRERLGPKAPPVMPAHVTILYPFKPPAALTGKVVLTLQDLFSEHPAFTVVFPGVTRLGDLLYLPPQPAEPFRRLIEAVVKHFPEYPPYAGAFSEIIPHLTIAEGEQEPRLKEMERIFHMLARDRLPIHARVESVLLMENTGGAWQTHTQFALRPAV